MPDEKIFKTDEAHGLLEVVKNYLLLRSGDLPAAESRGIARLLSEISYAWEVEAHPPISIPAGSTYSVEMHRRVLAFYRNKHSPPFRHQDD